MNNRNYVNSFARVLILGLLAVSFMSCRSYKDLSTPPEVELDGVFREFADTDTTTIANLPWKEYFTDTKLQALIEEGLENNLDLQIAVTRIGQAEANLSMAKGALLPSVGAGLQVNHTVLSDGPQGKDVLGYIASQSSNTQLGFTASWEVDLWGKLNSQSRAQYAYLLNSYVYKRLVQTELIANIANSYYSLIALDKQIKITKETIGLLDESTKTINSLKESGNQTEAAVEQSRALLYSTQLSVPMLESQVRQLENTISILLGRPLGSVERTSLDNQEVNEQLQIGVPAQLLTKRPDVKSAQLNVLAAYAMTDAAKASFYPSLNLSTASIGVAAGNLGDLFKPESIVANIVGGLTQPIFARGQLKGNLKVAEAQQQEAVLTFRNTILTAGKEVSDILFGFESSLQKNDYRSKQITSLKNAVDYTQQLLVSGEANYVEVLNAQQSLLSAQLNRVNDKLEQLNYGVNLYKALGGGSQN